MSTNPMILEMLGEPLKNAIVAAQERLEDDTVIARCSEGLWMVERGGEPQAEGLSYEAAIAAAEALA